jgi:hypothetical protein
MLSSRTARSADAPSASPKFDCPTFFWLAARANPDRSALESCRGPRDISRRGSFAGIQRAVHLWQLVHGPAPNAPISRGDPCLNVIVTRWLGLIKIARNPYRPELHYMRGPAQSGMRINLRKTKPMKRDLVYTTGDLPMSPFDTTHFLTPSPRQNRRRRARVEKVGLKKTVKSISDRAIPSVRSCASTRPRSS